MRSLCLFLLSSLSVFGASFDITAVRIDGTTSATASACPTASACNGWVAELDTSSSVATGGTYALGLSSLATFNKPSGAKLILTVTSSGYKTDGTTTTYTRTVYGTHQL